MKDYYAILGIKRTADITEIRNAYQKLSHIFQKGNTSNDPYLNERLKDINEAFEVLCDYRKRREHDIRISKLNQDNVEESFNSSIDQIKDKYDDTNIFSSSIPTEETLTNDLKTKNKPEAEKPNGYKINRYTIIFSGILLLLILGFNYCNKYLENEKIRILQEENQNKIRESLVKDSLANDKLIKDLTKSEGNWMIDDIINEEASENSNFICNPEMIIISSDKSLKRKSLEKDSKTTNYTLSVDSGTVLMKMENMAYLNNVSLAQKEDTLMILGFSNEKEVKFLLTRRGLYPKINIKNKSNIEEFRKKMETARMLIDDEKRYCTGISKMSENNVHLEGQDEDLYMNGIKVGQLMALATAKNTYLVKLQAEEILAEPNKKFYSIDYASKKEQYLHIEWLIGYTHPQADIVLAYQKIAKQKTDLAKAEIMKNIALKWHKYSWGKLESGSGMSYADHPIEYIYFQTKLDNSVKEKILMEIANSITGSGKGNAYYCLFLLNQYDWRSNSKAKYYLKKSLEIFESLPYKRFHNDMIEIIKEKLQTY